MDTMSEIIRASLNGIKEFKDSDTVIGNIITTPTGMTVIPISKISLGLATGGVDYTPKKVRSDFTFGGGGGTVASISPSAFLIITKDNDVKLFGELMNASHVSLRDDYEVTGIELDTLVEEAWKVEGVIGSRMTGAGFGGCTVSIVKDDAIDTFIKEVGTAYEQKIGYAADFYVVEIGDGPCIL